MGNPLRTLDSVVPSLLPDTAPLGTLSPESSYEEKKNKDTNHVNCSNSIFNNTINYDSALKE
jgi:hypothetical protein